MKKLILLSLLFLSLAVKAQINTERVQIQGKVNVDRDGDPEGINVFNLSSGEYTFTDEYGRFKIEVKEGDKLAFSSIQYQQFTVVITNSVINKERLDIDLQEGVTPLKEIEVKPDLSGDVRVDVKKLKTQKADFPTYNTKEVIQGYTYKFKPDRLNTVKNDAIDKGYLQNGLNFVNIFKSILGSHAKTKEGSKEDIDVQVRKMYNDRFFKKYLDIDKEHINDFIYYLESHGLTKAKLKNYNDLQIIQLLIEKGKDYKAQQKE